ncbi:MAG: YjjG family noncanonical pyrimidine nucleotidase [Clostridia bacterium]|nr:YjjG family noncanonical pyrimidine nucleotidase [Clostridia bacterium]
MGKYTTVFLDLDNTLLDFSKSEKHAIRKLLKKNGVKHSNAVISRYAKINQIFWEKFERGEIKKEEIFVGRFKMFLEELGSNISPYLLSDGYFELLPYEHHTVKGAKQILKYLKNKGITVCVTTNGVEKTQKKRISDSKFGKYFDYVFISECVGLQKPEKEYFDFAVNSVGKSDRSEILIVGDSPSSDILGGQNSGIDTCLYNPHNKNYDCGATYTIKRLGDLKKII